MNSKLKTYERILKVTSSLAKVHKILTQNYRYLVGVKGLKYDYNFDQKLCKISAKRLQVCQQNQEIDHNSVHTTYERPESFSVKLIENHLKTKEFICPLLECKQGFSKKIYLIAHMRRRHLMKRYKCVLKDCNKQFYFKYDLITHYKQAHFPKKFKCPYPGCRIACAKKFYLTAHINQIHKRVRTVRCNCPFKDCHKSYASKYSLRIHLNCHTKERMFVCPSEKCPKIYYLKESLNSHLKKFHPDIHL